MTYENKPNAFVFEYFFNGKWETRSWYKSEKDADGQLSLAEEHDPDMPYRVRETFFDWEQYEERVDG